MSAHPMVGGPWDGRDVFAGGDHQLQVVVKEPLPDGGGFAVYHWVGDHYVWRGETRATVDVAPGTAHACQVVGRVRRLESELPLTDEQVAILSAPPALDKPTLSPSLPSTDWVTVPS